jgi:hypothetical protein
MKEARRRIATRARRFQAMKEGRGGRGSVSRKMSFVAGTPVTGTQCPEFRVSPPVALPGRPIWGKQDMFDARTAW